jgi:hypothetical protein
LNAQLAGRRVVIARPTVFRIRSSEMARARYLGTMPPI